MISHPNHLERSSGNKQERAKIKGHGMKVCLYLEAESAVAKSGFRRAYQSHGKALVDAGVEVINNPTGFDYDVLHTHSFGPKTLYYIGKAKKHGIKVVVHAHSVGAHDFRDSYTMSNTLAPLYEKFLKYLYAKADAVFTPTPFAKRMLAELGVQRPVHVISNGVDLEKFAFDAKSRDQFRDQFGLRNFTVFGAGLIIPRKGISEFIELAKRLSEYDFIWFGHRWSKAMAFHPQMDREVSARPNNVHMAGYVEEPHKAFCAADILLFPSHTETQGMVLLEAAALGRPIVVRDLPEYEDWLTHDENCLKGRTNDEFEAHIKQLEKNPELYQRLAESALETAREHSMTVVGNRLKMLYHSLMEEEAVLNPELIQSTGKMSI